MKIEATVRHRMTRIRANNRIEWAIARHVAQHPTATPMRELLAAVREIRAAGFPVTMTLKINGRTIR